MFRLADEVRGDDLRIGRVVRDDQIALVYRQVHLVAHHQAVAFLLADMAIAIEGARLLVGRAATRADAGTLDEGEAHEAFLQAAECGQLVTNLGVQLLGGHGYIRDHLVEKWMREARTLTLVLGGTDGATDDASAACADAPPPKRRRSSR